MRARDAIVLGALFLSIVGCHGSSSSGGKSGKDPSVNPVIVDTGQETCFDDVGPAPCPAPGAPFHGQDAQYHNAKFSFRDNGDGTVTDLNTSLMWQKTPGPKLTWSDAVSGAGSFSLAGQDDWRLPTVKELYSLIDFDGDSHALPPVPYIDTTFFDFEWGDTSAGERLIDAQYWSSNEYVGRVFQGDRAAFGVNFADGRIKGYPTQNGPGGQPMRAFVRHVRGDTGYGVPDLVDNGDGTITDRTAGLMWTRADSSVELDWEGALAYAEALAVAGHDDWRLPNVKELQTIVDYSRAPDAIAPGTPGPAIDPIFGITETESYFWSSTTHLEGPGPSAAAYIAFGQAFGVGRDPLGNPVLINVHGAGAQRSDPKSGDPADYGGGLGPQADEVRIFNFVRCVRDAD